MRPEHAAAVIASLALLIAVMAYYNIR